MKKIYSLMLMASLALTAHAQTDSVAAELVLTSEDLLYKTDYPEGVYITKEEFAGKTPTKVIALTQKAVSTSKKHKQQTVPATCYFTDSSSSKKVKDAFAISHKGYLYVHVQDIMKNIDKKDRSQDAGLQHAYVRVLNGGKNYLYTELNLANAFAQGAMVGGFGMLGALAASQMVHQKGVVWDVAKKEFNIFKNCKDYNAFIKERLPDLVQTCENQQPNLASVRDAIDRIK